MLLVSGRDQRARNKTCSFFLRKVLTNKANYVIIIIERERYNKQTKRGNDYDKRTDD